MRIDITKMPVGEFAIFADCLQISGWWIQLSAETNKVWVQMDRPLVV